MSSYSPGINTQDLLDNVSEIGRTLSGEVSMITDIALKVQATLDGLLDSSMNEIKSVSSMLKSSALPEARKAVGELVAKVKEFPLLATNRIESLTSKVSNLVKSLPSTILSSLPSGLGTLPSLVSSLPSQLSSLLPGLPSGLGGGATGLGGLGGLGAMAQSLPSTILSSLPSGLGTLPSLVSSLPADLSRQTAGGLQTIKGLSGLIEGRSELVRKAIPRVLQGLVPTQPSSLLKGLPAVAGLVPPASAVDHKAVEKDEVSKRPKFLDKNDPATQFRMRSDALDGESLEHDSGHISETFEKSELDSLRIGLEAILQKEMKHYHGGPELHLMGAHTSSSDDENYAFKFGGSNFSGNLRFLKMAFEEVLRRELQKYGVAS